uniref:Uncharacterized protein n=1 Tax=Fagus sylvatica TaxID=28930 RepID=A0A2N9EQB8_FAGSY
MLLSRHLTLKHAPHLSPFLNSPGLIAPTLSRKGFTSTKEPYPHASRTKFCCEHKDLGHVSFVGRETSETSSSATDKAEIESISSQTTTLEDRFTLVTEAGQNPKNSAPPKIQKVISLLRDDPKEFKKYYEPKVLSLGPIHHGKPKYQLAEKYKNELTSEFVKDSGKDIRVLHKKIEENIKELRDCFEEEVTQNYDDKALAWLLFVDGCAILQYIYCHTNNMFKELNIKTDSVAFGQPDLFLLENQLPYRLLEWLMSLSVKEKDLRKSIEDYIEGHINVPMDQHSMCCLDCVQELRAAGIRMVRSKNEKCCLSDISFTTLACLGYLFLPPIIVDDSTRPKFLNLIAYERCLDFKNDFGVTSYISFLNSLIDEANDVKILRKAGVLYNCLGCDEEVAKLFNEIGTNLVPNTEIYNYVRSQIQKHYMNKWMNWMAQFFHDHFSSPWMIFAFCGVLVGLGLTAIQTWFAVHPAK